jgi:hypothetical protein
VNSDLVENGSVSESVEELHDIHSTTRLLLNVGTSHSDVIPSGIAGGPITKSRRKTVRDEIDIKEIEKKGRNV